MKIRRLSLVCALLFTLTFTSGCWDKHELEEQAYVVAIGADLAPDNPDERIVTAQIAIPSKMSGGTAGGGGEGKSFFALSIRAKSVFSGFDAMQAAIARRINLKQCKMILISEEYARKSIAPMVRVVSRHPQLRRTMGVIVIQGSVKEFLEKNEPKLTSNISKYYEESAKSEAFTGFSTLSSLQAVVEAAETPGENAIVSIGSLNKNSTDDPLLENAPSGQLSREGGSKGEFLGVAVFKADKMVGKLGKLETEALNLLRGDWRTGPFSVPSPLNTKELIGLQLKQESQPRVEVDLNSDPIRIDVKLDLSAILESEFSDVDFTQGEQRKALENSIKEEVESRSAELIKRAQTEFDSDIFRFGNRAVKKRFLFWQDWEDFKWYDKFAQTDIHVTANTHVRWFGDQNAPSKMAP